jgi:TatD DNase family protein
LELAAELDLPFIIHCRAAEAETLAVLAEYTGSQQQGCPCHTLRGVWHCFTSTRAFAEQAAELGLYFGLGGITTYPKAQELRDVVAALPADRILLETDCPFLPPQPWRGKRNEPAYMTEVIKTLAAARRTSAEEIEQLTTRNAEALFRFKLS